MGKLDSTGTGDDEKLYFMEFNSFVYNGNYMSVYVYACICVFKRERFHCLCVRERETSPTPVKFFVSNDQ